MSKFEPLERFHLRQRRLRVVLRGLADTVRASTPRAAAGSTLPDEARRWLRAQLLTHQTPLQALSTASLQAVRASLSPRSSRARP